MSYKPVECQSLEKDEPDLNLFPCINYCKEHNCCRGYYDFIINKKYEFVVVNKKDLDSECIKHEGKSNIFRCCYFQPEFLSTQWSKRY